MRNTWNKGETLPLPFNIGIISKGEFALIERIDSIPYGSANIIGRFDAGCLEGFEGIGPTKAR